MIELFLETGIRRGELLKLYTTDINQGSQHAYVTINDREHDPADPRAKEPALKTHGRTVVILHSYMRSTSTTSRANGDLYVTANR